MTSIAKKTKTSVQLLAETNSIENVDFLLSGQMLQLPSNSEGLEMVCIRHRLGTDLRRCGPEAIVINAGG